MCRTLERLEARALLSWGRAEAETAARNPSADAVAGRERAVTTPSAEADGFVWTTPLLQQRLLRKRMSLQPLRWLLKAPSEPCTQRVRLLLYFTVQVLRRVLCSPTSRTCIRKSRTVCLEQPVAIEASRLHTVVLLKSVVV